MGAIFASDAGTKLVVSRSLLQKTLLIMVVKTSVAFTHKIQDKSVIQLNKGKEETSDGMHCYDAAFVQFKIRL